MATTSQRRDTRCKRGARRGAPTQRRSGRPPACKRWCIFRIGSLAIICPLFPYTTLFRSCQDGFRDASSKHNGGFECRHRIPRSVSRLGSTDHTICSFSREHTPELQSRVGLVSRLVTHRSWQPPPRGVIRDASEGRGAEPPRNADLDGPRPARGGASFESDRLRSYVRSFPTRRSSDLAKMGFATRVPNITAASSVATGFRGVSRVSDRPITPSAPSRESTRLNSSREWASSPDSLRIDHGNHLPEA